MTDQISLEPRVSLLPTAPGGASSLPIDLQEDAARRLRALCLLLTVVVVLNVLAEQTFRAPFLPARVRLLEDAFILGLSGLVYWLSYRLTPRRIIDVGLAYSVLFGAILAATTVPFNWFVDPEHGFVWSPNAVWVLVFPVMVPSTMSRTLIAAALAAAAEPIAAVYFAWRVDEWVMPGFAESASRLWPNLVAVVVAMSVTRAIHRLGEKLRAARSVGNYHLETQLGEGGMGQVWKASHRLLARPAAVKLISPDALDARGANVERLFLRFEREAQATAQLQSPHTIGVYDFGIARDGTFYYVMELLDGLDLHTLVERHGPQPPSRVTHILLQACHSLAEAHARGLIHRDIKPANIFLCRYGLDLDFVKVLDFGLVKPQEQDEAPANVPRLTQQQVVTGTPGFIAPEAIMSEAALDGRADLYSLGCVAYFLLTGREVFQHASLMATLMSHANQPPVPPSVHTPDIPPGLEATVLSLLEKDPTRRPQTASELAAQLEALGLAEAWDDRLRAAWWAGRVPDTVGDASSSAPTQVL